MNQTCDQTVDDIAGTSSITSTLHVKSLSRIRWTARASAAKVVRDKRHQSWLRQDACLLRDVKAEAQRLR